MIIFIPVAEFENGKTVRTFQKIDTEKFRVRSKHYDRVCGFYEGMSITVWKDSVYDSPDGAIGFWNYDYNMTKQTRIDFEKVCAAC